MEDGRRQGMENKYFLVTEIGVPGDKLFGHLFFSSNGNTLYRYKFLFGKV